MADVKMVNCKNIRDLQFEVLMQQCERRIGYFRLVFQTAPQSKWLNRSVSSGGQVSNPLKISKEYKTSL